MLLHMRVLSLLLACVWAQHCSPSRANTVATPPPARVAVMDATVAPAPAPAPRAPDASTVTTFAAQALGSNATFTQWAAELSRMRNNTPENSPECMFQNAEGPGGPIFRGNAALREALPAPLDTLPFDPTREVPEVWTVRGTLPTGSIPSRGRIVVVTETPYDAFDGTAALVSFTNDALHVRARVSDAATQRFARNTSPATWSRSILREEPRTVVVTATGNVPLATLIAAWQFLRSRVGVVAFAIPVESTFQPTLPRDNAPVMACPIPPPPNPGGTISERTLLGVLSMTEPRITNCIRHRFASEPRSLMMFSIETSGQVGFVCSLGGSYAPSEQACLQQLLRQLRFPPMERAAIVEHRFQVGGRWQGNRACPP